jgi:hypothetical protein
MVSAAAASAAGSKVRAEVVTQLPT